MFQRLKWVVTVACCGLLAALPARAEETAPSLDEMLSVEDPVSVDAFTGGIEEDVPADMGPARLSMEFEDTDLGIVLKAFSKQTGINIIAGDEVADRPVSIYFEDVTALDALDQILAAGNLTYERPAGSDIYVVKRKPEAATEPTTITRVYRLRFARVSESIMARAAAAFNELTPVEAVSATAGEADPPALSDAGEGIDSILKELLTDQGEIVTDPRTNSVVITDIPANFPRIEAALAALDVKTHQILVDAEVIETTLTKLKDLGVEWGSGAEGDMVNLTMGSRSTRFPFGFIGDRMAPGNPTAFTTSTLSFANATAVLQALENDTDSKVLARPKVLTLDNESAMIRLTSNETIGFKVTTGESSGTSQAEAERTTTGIVLGVTPQVNDDGYLTMLVAPSVTTTVPAKISAPAGTADVRDPKTRGTHTTVRIRSGDTLVVGGLINREESHGLRKVPILSGIPVIGEAFKNEEVDNTASELIVFVTPRVIGEPLASQVASAGSAAAGGPREQEQGPASQQDVIEQTLNRLEQPSL